MTSILNSLTVLLCVLRSGKAAGTIRQTTGLEPTANTINGTYVGYYAPAYNTDNFLGMPFAQPPTGNLRFHVPVSLNTSWSGIRNATQYGPECIGYGLDTESQGNYVSEDCLTLNVIRSRGAGDKLPVLVWIHGGGFYEGGSADHRYNQSFIVQQSAKAGMPIVAVSINYRLASWGFLYGKAIKESGNAMNGYRDQRLALHWVQENIEAFGGDPSRVTIQGESAGGYSVGAQLLAYNGRDDKLFAHAIAESGAPISFVPYATVQSWEPVIANISNGVGCTNDSDVLACLRAVDVETLNAVINSTATAGATYGAVIDGDFMVDDAATQLERGSFVHVPYIIGCNSDEGTSFGPSAINTTEQFLAYLKSTHGVDNATAQDLSILYPDVPAIGIPGTIAGRPNATVGLQYKRTSAVAGDIYMHAPRRLTAQAWASHNVTVYTYRFNVLVNGISFTIGSTHFQEVAFVFYNTEGYGYPQNLLPNPMCGFERPKYLALAELMVRMWISFINFGDPNNHLGGMISTEQTGFKGWLMQTTVAAAYWPMHTIDEPQNFVFEQNVTSHLEPDLYRTEAIQYITDLIKARRGSNCSGLAACA